MNKKYRTLTAALFLLLASEVCFGQSSFQGLTPGESTRRDVERVLGKAVRVVDGYESEYTPPQGMGKLSVVYSPEHFEEPKAVGIIRIELLKPVTRAALVQRFKLPDKADVREVYEGKLLEYFGDPRYIIFTYKAGDEASGVSMIEYFSPTLYKQLDQTALSGAKPGGGRETAARDRTEVGSQLGKIIEGIAKDGKGAAVGAIIRDEPKGGRVSGSPPRAGDLRLSSVKVSVLADKGWTGTGLLVRKGQRVRVSAEGRVSLGQGRFSTPAGQPGVEDPERLIRDRPTGALIAVIGDDNDEFIFVGSSNEFTATRDGQLFLGVNERNLDDNTGAYDALVEFEPVTGGVDKRGGDVIHMRPPPEE